MTSSPYNEPKSESTTATADQSNMNTSSIYDNSEYIGGSSQAIGGNNDMMDDIVDSTDDLEDLDDFDNTENNYGHLKMKSASGGNGGSGGTSSTGGGSNSELGGGVFEDDKKKRRAIANSNERRRMQSINAGFQTLKSLIPHSSGEKLSKACILQRSAEHMKHLSKEKDKLSLNFQLAIKIIESNGLLSQYQTSTLDASTSHHPHHHQQSHHHSKSTVKHLTETTNNNIVQHDSISGLESTQISSAQSTSTSLTPIKSTTPAANITSKRKSISSLVNSPPPPSSTVNKSSSAQDSSLIVKSPSNKISAHLSQQQFIQDELKSMNNNQPNNTNAPVNRQLTDATNLNKPPYSSITATSIANIAAAVAAANQPTPVYPIATATSQPIQLTLDTTAKKLNEIFVTDHTAVSSNTSTANPSANIIQLQPATNASGLQLNLNALDIRLLNGSGNATASDLILPTAVILDTSRAVLQPLVATTTAATTAAPIITQQQHISHHNQQQSDTDDNEEEFEEYDDEPDDQESNNKSSGRQTKPQTLVVANTKPIKIKNMTSNAIGAGHHHSHQSGVKSARSNSIDQLIAAAVATSPSSSSTCSTTSSASTSTASSVSNPTTLANMGSSGCSLVTTVPTASFQPSSSSNPATVSNPIMIVDDILPPPPPPVLARKNLNTIVEAIKHVEGKNYVDEFADMNLKINTTGSSTGASCSSDASSSGGSSSSSVLAYSPGGSSMSKEAYLISKVSPTAQKPPKKRKYTTEDLGNLTEPSQQLLQQQQQQIVPTTTANRPSSPSSSDAGFLSLLVKSN